MEHYNQKYYEISKKISRKCMWTRIIRWSSANETSQT
jgi:hypothetical protein